MKITIPDGWHQVSISQFIEMSQLDISKKDYSINVISVLSDVDSEEIRKYSTETYNNILSSLAWTNNLPDESKFKKVIEIDGVQYGMINKFSELSSGNWVDIEEYLNGHPENMHKVLSILYRPLITALNDDYRVIEDYSSGEGELRANLFYEKLNIQDVFGCAVFFCLIANLCMKNIKTYLESQIREEKRTSARKNLTRWQRVKSGLGSILFTPWQRETLQRLSRS